MKDSIEQPTNSAEAELINTILTKLSADLGTIQMQLPDGSIENVDPSKLREDLKERIGSMQLHNLAIRRIKNEFENLTSVEFNKPAAERMFKGMEYLARMDLLTPSLYGLKHVPDRKIIESEQAVAKREKLDKVIWAVRTMEHADEQRIDAFINKFTDLEVRLHTVSYADLDTQDGQNREESDDSPASEFLNDFASTYTENSDALLDFYQDVLNLHTWAQRRDLSDSDELALLEYYLINVATWIEKPSVDYKPGLPLQVEGHSSFSAAGNAVMQLESKPTLEQQFKSEMERRIYRLVQKLIKQQQVEVSIKLVKAYIKDKTELALKEVTDEEISTIIDKAKQDAA